MELSSTKCADMAFSSGATSSFEKGSSIILFRLNGNRSPRYNGSSVDRNDEGNSLLFRSRSGTGIRNTHETTKMPGYLHDCTSYGIHMLSIYSEYFKNS